MRAAVAFVSLFCCMPTALLAQSARQEKAINLPAGVSVEVSSVSPAGNLIAGICSDDAVRVWSAQSGELIQSLKEHGGLQGGVQFSHDGRLLAVSYETVKYEKGTIKVFDVHSWKVQDDFVSECMFCVLRFSRDGRRLASGGNSDANLWDVATQKKVATISPPFGGSAALSFSSDSKSVATANGDGFVRVYDANTGTGRIPSYTSTLDGIAKQLVTTVNGAISGADASGPSAKPFFTGTTAATIAVNPALTASGTTPPYSAAEANAVAGLASGPADQAYDGFVTQIGSDVQSAQNAQQTRQALMTAIDNQRQSISGVSLDEEMTNLMTYQQAYQASARVMNAINETLNTLINQVGAGI